jgi:hypothetical protein
MVDTTQATVLIEGEATRGSAALAANLAANHERHHDQPDLYS